MAPGSVELTAAAVLFHVTFVGQAIVEDIRQLRSIPPGGTNLESLLRVQDGPTAGAPPPTPAMTSTATLRPKAIEHAILHGLKARLMDPSLFEEFAREFMAEVNKQRSAASAAKAGIIRN